MRSAFLFVSEMGLIVHPSLITVSVRGGCCARDTWPADAATSMNTKLKILFKLSNRIMFIVFYMIILRLQSYDCKNKGFPTFHNTNINYPCIFAKVNGRGRL